MKTGLKQGRMKILIIKPSSLGDVVHSLPFLNSIRACYPKAEIHWVIAKGLEGLLEGHPMLNKLVIIDKDRWKKLRRLHRTLGELRRLFRDIGGEYDLVIDLQGLLRSGLIAMASGAPVRIGFAEAREGSALFYTRKVAGGRNIHAVERYLKIAEALGCFPESILFPFPLVKEESEKIRNIKASLKDYAVIVPGARWDTKIWPAENFGRIAAMLPFPSLVVGGGSDAALAEEVVRNAEGKAVSLAGSTSLKELIEVMRTARVVISNDSGPMHIAAGFGVPVVAIFGPTSRERTGPYGKGHLVVESAVECAPCFRRRCKDLKCMKAIAAGEVYERMRRAGLPRQ